jgi:hypothetical protein
MAVPLHEQAAPSRLPTAPALRSRGQVHPLFVPLPPLRFVTQRILLCTQGLVQAASLGSRPFLLPRERHEDRYAFVDTRSRRTSTILLT